MRTSSKYTERNHSVTRFEIEDEDVRDEVHTGIGDMFLGAWIALLLIAALSADKIADALYTWGF